MPFDPLNINDSDVKIHDIQASWKQDSVIDRTELGDESLRIPLLHSKYFEIFSEERLKLKQMTAEFKKMVRLKHEYFTGTISEEELKQHEWQPYQLKILRADLSMYMDSDPDLQQIALRINLQEEKVDFLESIIKSLTNRGFQIKAAIDWAKFQMGG